MIGEARASGNCKHLEPQISWRGIAATKFEKENIEPQNTEYRMPKCNNFVILHSLFDIRYSSLQPSLFLVIEK